MSFGGIFVPNLLVTVRSSSTSTVTLQDRQTLSATNLIMKIGGNSLRTKCPKIDAGWRLEFNFDNTASFLFHHFHWQDQDNSECPKNISVRAPSIVTAHVMATFLVSCLTWMVIILLSRLLSTMIRILGFFMLWDLFSDSFVTLSSSTIGRHKCSHQSMSPRFSGGRDCYHVRSKRLWHTYDDVWYVQRSPWLRLRRLFFLGQTKANYLKTSIVDKVMYGLHAVTHPLLVVPPVLSLLMPIKLSGFLEWTTLYLPQRVNIVYDPVTFSIRAWEIC